LLLRLQAQLSMKQINDAMKKAKLGQLSSGYLDPQFTASPELIDQLSELLDEVANT
jgi:hypothetical protein